MLSKILTAGVGTTAEKLAGAIRQFVTTDADRARIQLEFERLLLEHAAEQEQTLRAELQLRERVMTAELEQGDAYTKRARPTIVYAGLAMIAFNYCAAPLLGLDALALPTEFWVAWGGVVGIYSVGRSYEKHGGQTAISRAITGSEPKRSLF